MNELLIAYLIIGVIATIIYVVVVYNKDIEP